jgi:hypothetical protein
MQTMVEIILNLAAFVLAGLTVYDYTHNFVAALATALVVRALAVK